MRAATKPRMVTERMISIMAWGGTINGAGKQHRFRCAEAAAQLYARQTDKYSKMATVPTFIWVCVDLDYLQRVCPGWFLPGFVPVRPLGAGDALPCAAILFHSVPGRG